MRPCQFARRPSELQVSRQSRDKVSGRTAAQVAPLAARFNRRVWDRVHVAACSVRVNVGPTWDASIRRDGRHDCRTRGRQMEGMMWVGRDHRAASDQEHGKPNRDVLFESHRTEYRTPAGCREWSLGSGYEDFGTADDERTGSRLALPGKLRFASLLMNVDHQLDSEAAGDPDQTV